jgi:hypothetical protein
MRQVEFEPTIRAKTFISLDGAATGYGH